jgi:hypothetical protein
MLLLSSCQPWGPTWSEVTGTRYYSETLLDVEPVLFSQIDGSSPGNTPGQPIKITPGRHTLVLQLIPPSSVVGPVHLEQIVLDAAPRKRYYINGRFAASPSTDWKPFIHHDEQISDCQAPAAARSG